MQSIDYGYKATPVNDSSMYLGRTTFNDLLYTTTLFRYVAS